MLVRAVVTAVFLAGSCVLAQDTIPRTPGTEFIRDVPYGSESEKQRLDMVYFSSKEKRVPAVIYVHGGGWGGGDKGDDPDMMMDMLDGFASDGFVAVSMNYRLSGEAKFPAAVSDCKQAIRWLRAHADTYGVDKNRIGVVGGSAGGHLAAMIGVTGDLHEFDGDGPHGDQSSAVQAAVSVSGPTDLQVSVCASKPEDRAQMVGNFLGVMAADNMELARKASPVTYVCKELPPMLLIHCKDDQSIDADQSIRLADALIKAGAPAELLLLDGSNHGSDMARTEPVLSDIRAFFRRVLGDAKP
ncbi:MAG: lipase [Candidatus Hydrogenedentota bacterium]